MPQHRQELTVQHFPYYKSLFPATLICGSSVMHTPSAEKAQRACTETTYSMKETTGFKGTSSQIVITAKPMARTLTVAKKRIPDFPLNKFSVTVRIYTVLLPCHPKYSLWMLGLQLHFCLAHHSPSQLNTPGNCSDFVGENKV